MSCKHKENKDKNSDIKVVAKGNEEAVYPYMRAALL